MQFRVHPIEGLVTSSPSDWDFRLLAGTFFLALNHLLSALQFRKMNP
jgi:hypothetical protein